MNVIDLFVAVTMLVTVGYGLFKGLVVEVFSLGGVILGFIGANFGSGYVAPYLKPYLGLEGLDRVLAYALIFVGVSIGMSLIGVAVRRLVRAAWLGWADRFGGGAVGLVKGTLICLVAVVIATTFLPAESPTLKGSVLTPYFLTVGDYLLTLAPKEFLNKFAEKKNALTIKLPAPGKSSEKTEKKPQKSL